MWFHVAVVVNLLRSRPASAIRMALVAFIAALWCVGGFVWTLATWRDLDRQASEIKIEVVVKPTVAESIAQNMARDIRRMPSVREAIVVFPTQVWKEFSDELGVNDELKEVVVLPIIIRFSPLVENVNEKWISMVSTSIQSIYSQNVQEVMWPRDYVRMIDARRMDIALFGGAAGVLSLFVFLTAMQYAFKSGLQLASQDLKVLSRMGAPPIWSATPHLLLQLICGFSGFILAVGGFIVLRPQLINTAPWLGFVSTTEILALTSVMAGIGILFALIHSLSATRKSYYQRGAY